MFRNARLILTQHTDSLRTADLPNMTQPFFITTENRDNNIFRQAVLNTLNVCTCAKTKPLFMFHSAELEYPRRLSSGKRDQIHFAHKLWALKLVAVEADVQRRLQCHKVGGLVKKAFSCLRVRVTCHVTASCLLLCLFVCSDIIVQLSSTACWNASFLDQRYQQKCSSHPSGLHFSCSIFLSCKYGIEKQYFIT